ncbi:MAG: hypothetical protein LC789_14480 [Actinobacteria bacterium]|nr:hypothetical protein [Actinomycetota bacterium]MCA1720801.1 hypothetical protein [Actinomycetota bacterium]
MKYSKALLTAAVAVGAVVVGAGPAAAADTGTATAAGGQVLCAQYVDANGHPVGPEVCVPLIVPWP